MKINDIEKNQYGWWASDGKGTYIHSDGELRPGTKHPNGKYTGYHKTKKALLTAMIKTLATTTDPYKSLLGKTFKAKRKCSSQYGKNTLQVIKVHVKTDTIFTTAREEHQPTYSLEYFLENYKEVTT